MAPTYTTQAAFEEYVPGWVTDNPGELEKLLERAERDVDAFLGPIRPRPETGLKFDPTLFAHDWERTALSNAVCAQAFFRLGQGEAALAIGRTTKSEKGPDFEAQYTDTGTAAAGSLIGPMVRTELAPIRHLRRLTAQLT